MGYHTQAHERLGEIKLGIKSWIPLNCPCRLCKDYGDGIGFANEV